MFINYLLLAHKNPNQLKRLIDKLNSPNCAFYIHIDKDVDELPFRSAIKVDSNINYVDKEKRQSGLWGDRGIVIATINLLHLALSQDRDGYCVLLSGQDYPLKNNAFISTFFASNYPKDFVNHFSLPTDKWPGGGMERIAYYKINFSKRKGDFILYPSIFHTEFYKRTNLINIKKLLVHTKFSDFIYLFKKRQFPKYIKPYGGSQWWAITTETAKKVIDFLELHIEYLRYHQYTLLPDEIFFQSIFLEIHKDTPDLIRETITYVDFQRKNVPLPVTFTATDFTELKNLTYEVLFARKFDMEVDEIILDKIDSELS